MSPNATSAHAPSPTDREPASEPPVEQGASVRDGATTSPVGSGRDGGQGEAPRPATSPGTSPSSGSGTSSDSGPASAATSPEAPAARPSGTWLAPLTAAGARTNAMRIPTTPPAAPPAAPTAPHEDVVPAPSSTPAAGTSPTSGSTTSAATASAPTASAASGPQTSAFPAPGPQTAPSPAVVPQSAASAAPAQQAPAHQAPAPQTPPQRTPAAPAPRPVDARTETTAAPGRDRTPAPDADAPRPTPPPVAPSTPEDDDEQHRGGPAISARVKSTEGHRSRRAVAVVVAAAVIGAVLGGLGSLLAGPSYSTESQVLWNPAGVQYADETVNADPNLVERQVTDQVDVIMSDAVMSRAADTLGEDVDDLREQVTVGVATGSSLLVVAGSGDSASEATDVTTAVTDSYVTYLRDNGREVLNQRADVLQGTIERQTAQLAELDAQLNTLNDQLGGLNPETAAYGAVQGRIDRLATQISDLTTRSADLVDQQETLRANAAIFPGEAFVLQQAVVPEGPSSLSPLKAALVGAALGLVIGACVVAFTASRSRQGGRGHRTVRTAP